MLQFDEISKGIGLGLDEAAVEAVFFHKRQNRGPAVQKLPVKVSAGIRVHPVPAGQIPVQMRQEGSENPGHRLQQTESVSESQFGYAQLFSPHTGMIKKVFEIALVFDRVDRDGVRRQLTDDVLLFAIENDAVEETLQQPGNHARARGKEAKEIVVGPV